MQIKAEKINTDKRNFLKALGLAGVGAVVLNAMPQKAEAAVLGSNPAKSVLGIRNSTNTAKANPATEVTLSSLKSTADNINTAFSSIVTNTAKIPSKGPVARVQSMPVAIATNQPTLPVRGSMNFSTASMVAGDDQSLFYLRKAVKLLEPWNMVDASRRKRIIVDASQSDLSFTMSSAVTTIASQSTQMFQDIARDAFARGIRRKLQFR